MDHTEVKIVIDENKIREVGKYPVSYIFHHIACLAKTRKMYLSQESVDEQTGKHMVAYRTDYETNPNAPITAGFFANHVYLSPANPYLVEMTLYDSKDNSLEDCISGIKEMEDKYGGVYSDKKNNMSPGRKVQRELPKSCNASAEQSMKDKQEKENLDYAETKIIIDENKIKEVGKYPVSYIFHHIACLAKTRKMYLSQENVDEQMGKHMVVYRTDYKTNPNAPYTAAFLATYVYISPAKDYLSSMTVYDSRDGSVEDSISSIEKIEAKYGKLI